MGFFGRLTGWDQDKAASNAVLAEHLLGTLSSSQKHEIVGRIIQQFVNFDGKTFPQSVVKRLNGCGRVTQMNFVAMACRDLQITPRINDGVGWRVIQNPFAAGNFTRERDLEVSAWYLEKKFGVAVKWPGDDVRVDFSDWYVENKTSQGQGNNRHPTDTATDGCGLDVYATSRIPPFGRTHICLN